MNPEEEFKKMLGFRPEMRRPSVNRTPVTEVPDIDLPASFDWRDYKAVTPVKNQVCLFERLKVYNCILKICLNLYIN